MTGALSAPPAQAAPVQLTTCSLLLGVAVSVTVAPGVKLAYRLAWKAVTLDGPTLLFDDRRTVAVAGGKFATSLDGRAVKCGEAVQVVAGQRLAVGARVRAAALPRPAAT